jgi:alanine racemase
VRPTRAEISLTNLRHNLRALKRRTKAPVYAVLKADGYGHGAKAVARTLERAGADGVSVALLEEGIELREAGIDIPILVMGGYYGRAYAELLHHDLTPVIYDAGQAQALAEEVRFNGAAPIGVHLKVDTGMSRLGASPSEAVSIAKTIVDESGIFARGLMTHFHSADTSRTSMEEQLDLFDTVTRGLTEVGFDAPLRHAANSAALLDCPRAHLDMVRPGIALFGVEPALGLAPELRPMMRVRSEIIALRSLEPGQTAGYGGTWMAPKKCRLATIPIGYADGVSRASAGKTDVLIKGCRAPIVGAVSMDMITVDVTDIASVSVCDEVVLLGTQRGPHGSATITATEIAERTGTIAWEVLTNISRRVPRFYRED